MLLSREMLSPGSLLKVPLHNLPSLTMHNMIHLEIFVNKILHL